MAYYSQGSQSQQHQSGYSTPGRGGADGRGSELSYGGGGGGQQTPRGVQAWVQQPQMGTYAGSQQQQHQSQAPSAVDAQDFEAVAEGGAGYYDGEDDVKDPNARHRIDRRFIWLSFGIALLTCLMQLLAVIVPHWWVFAYYSQGLWVRCSYYAQWMNCVDDFEITDFLHAARALEVISLIVYFFAFCCSMLHFVHGYKRSFWVKIGISAGIGVGGLMSFVGAVALIGKVKETQPQSQPGASFIIAIINVVISWAYTTAFCLNFRKF